MYGIVLLRLMDLVNEEGVVQKWYADDGYVAGSIESLRILSGKFKLHGPAFGYNITKCHLITKDSSLDKAKYLFKDEDVKLGEDIAYWGPLLVGPRPVTLSSPLNHAFTKGVQNKLTFLSRTTRDIKITLRNTESLNDETDPQHQRPWSAICNVLFSLYRSATVGWISFHPKTGETICSGQKLLLLI